MKQIGYVLLAMEQDGAITSRQISELCGLTVKTVSAVLSELRRGGTVVFTGWKRFRNRNRDEPTYRVATAADKPTPINLRLHQSEHSLTCIGEHCQICKKEHTRASSAYWAKVRNKNGNAQHGTTACYRQGCHCKLCTQVWAKYYRNRRLALQSKK